MTGNSNAIEGGAAVLAVAEASSATGTALQLDGGSHAIVGAAAASSRVRYKKPKRSMTPYSELEISAV